MRLKTFASGWLSYWSVLAISQFDWLQVDQPTRKHHFGNAPKVTPRVEDLDQKFFTEPIIQIYILKILLILRSRLRSYYGLSQSYSMIQLIHFFLFMHTK